MRGDIADGWTYDLYGLYGTSLLAENYQNDLSSSRIGNFSSGLNLGVLVVPSQGTSVRSSKGSPFSAREMRILSGACQIDLISASVGTRLRRLSPIPPRCGLR